MPTQNFDVAIIGGALAGCTAAIFYARAGLQVALVERQPKADSFKQLCTHFIQPCATPTLRRLGIEDALLAAGAVRNAVDTWTPWGWVDEPEIVDEDGKAVFGYNIRRQTLDPLLRQLASDTAGVTTFFGSALTSLEQHGDTVTSITIQGRESTDITASLFVAADGRNSKLASLAGIATRQTPNTRAGIFAHYRNLGLARGTRSQSWITGEDVAYIFPNDDGVTVVACMPNKRRVPEFKDDAAASMERFINSLDDHPNFTNAERISETFVVKDYPNQTRSPTYGNIALIGDTSLSMDPLFGVGCGWALQTAEWLVETTATPLLSKLPIARGLKSYAGKFRRQLNGHIFSVADFSKRSGFNLLERLMFSAATRNLDMARHVSLFTSRITGVAQFVAPRALLKALWINFREPRAPVARPRVA